LRKAETDSTDALKVQSIKHSKSSLECQTALVAALDAKTFNDTELLKSYLPGRKRIINFCRQTNTKRHS